MSKKIKNEQKKFLGETLNQYDKALDEAINQLDKKNREQNHKISSLVNSFDNEFLEKDVEGNMTTLENSKDGMVIINEIQGSTEVNYCKDGEKELILNGDIDTQGESFVTITEGVDGGLVDVSLEGNTEINLSKTKDPVLVTREFDDINCNVGKLQYTIDDVTTINDEPGKVDIDRIVGDTMVNHAVNGSEELILNAHINESGDNSITLNGVTSDGGKVDVALEGNTLVNVSKTKDSTALPLEEELTYLYANTQYTLQFVSDKAITADITLGGTQLLAQNIVKGLNKITITTPSELVDNKLIINGAGAKICEVVVTDTDRAFKYFEGMKSVGECEELEVKSNNKNLFDMNDLLNYLNENSEYGSYEQNGDGYNIVCNRASTDLYTNFKPNTIYTLKMKCSALEGFSRTQLMFIYDDGTVQYSGVSDTLSDKVVVSFNKSIKSLKLTKASGLSKSYFEYIQIEEGSTATDYTPHQSNTQQLTHEPLRAVGDVKDRYVLIDGKWYIERNCGEVVFDGSDDEVWTLRNHTQGIAQGVPCDRYALDGDIFKDGKQIGDNYFSALCDKYKVIKGEDSQDTGIEGIVVNGGTGNWRLMITTKLDSKAKFISWLQQNPLTVVYELATPQYEPLEYNPLEVYSEVTHITTNSTIPTNITVKNHGYNLVALKENTQYTLYVNKDTTNALTYRLGDYIEVTAPSKFTFTTPSTLTDKTLRIDGKGAKVNDLMLIEGTPTNDSIGYFDGLKSSYEYEQVIDELDENYGKYKVNVKVVGKNLWKDNIKSTQYDWSELIKLDKNKTYTASYSTSSKTPYIRQYNENKKVIPADETFQTKGRSITGASYISIQNFKYLTNLQLEQGDTVTEYEPYFESKQTVYLNSPLLKGDEIVWKDNKIQHYHKMHKEVFDGSEDEEWGSVESKGNNIKFGKIFSSAKYFSLHKCPLKCDNFITQSAIFDESLYEMATIYGHSETYKELRLSICKSKLQTQNLQGFKQWLQQNPTTVVYPLETPYYEEISDYPLKLNVIANSSLSTESTIQVTNISFNIYEETLPYLYPNTKYYITFNADVDRNNIIIDLGGNHIVFDCKVGFNKVEITTPSDTTNLLTFSGTGVNIDHVKVTQQDIDEYFEGMKSVGECEGNIEILSQNKNLFDGIFISGNVAPTGEITSYADRVVTPNYLKIDPNIPLFIHGFDNIAYICYYDSDKNVIVRNTYGKNNRPLVNNVPSNAMYIRISIVDCTDVSLPMMVEQSIVTEGYVEHQSNSQQLTHEPLRAVGNVKDKYILLDGKWYIERNCGKIVLDNTNNWTIDAYNDTYYRCRVQIQDKKNNANCIADKYSVLVSSWKFGYITSYTDLLYFQVSASIATDLNTFKQYMGENPITVIYELATPQYEPIDYNPFEVYADTTHITTNSLIPTNVVVKNHGYNCILKPSTKYTIALNKPNGTISAKLGGSKKVDSTNSIFTITTPSTLNDNILRLSGSGKVKDIIILEGDKTVNTPSYFEGIESAFEQEYDTEKGKYRVTAKVIGKNLFNFDTLEFIENREGWIVDSNGLLTKPSVGKFLNTRIKVEGLKPNTTYTLSVEENIRPMTTNKNMFTLQFGDNSSNLHDIITYTTKYNETSTIITMYSKQIVDNGTELYVKNIQIEEGDTATAYEPYKESNVTFYVNEPLRGIKGVKDKAYIQDNKMIVQRNCVSKVFDGSDDEDWKTVNNSYARLLLSPKPKLNSNNKCENYMCDTLKKSNNLSLESGMFINDAIRVKTEFISNAEQARAWFAKNPTTVVYQLAEPIYEEADCDLSKLVLENYENSSLIFESNIPVNANIRYSGEVPVITQAKSLSSQVDNTTLDINENIIPYMCDIDYRIVELQLMNGDTQGEGIELLGIGDIEILSNENVLFNNREDKKYNYSYDMLKRDILSQRYSKEEYQYRLDRYLLANKISDEEYKELEGLLNNGE